MRRALGVRAAPTNERPHDPAHPFGPIDLTAITDRPDSSTARAERGALDRVLHEETRTPGGRPVPAAAIRNLPAAIEQRVPEEQMPAWARRPAGH